MRAVQYALEPYDSASYEFDLGMGNGRVVQMEVDAGSGRIVEAHPQFYAIGQQPGAPTAQAEEQTAKQH